MFYKQTVGTSGSSVSGTAPITDINIGRASKFNVSFNSLPEITVTLPVAGCTSSALTAGAIQTALTAALVDNSIGGTVTCTYGSGVYLITYTGLEVSNTVVITNSATNNCAALLKLGVANGGTEVAGAAATSTSDSTPATQLAVSLETTFKCALNGQAAVAVVLSLTGKTTGALVAAEMQTKINAALISGGKTGSVTVVYSGGVYVVTSAFLGQASAVVITDGDTFNIADALKIGSDNGGTEAIGTRMCKICDISYPNINVMCPTTKEIYFYKDAAKEQKLFCHCAGVLSSSFEQNVALSGPLYCEALEDSVVVFVNLW